MLSLNADIMMELHSGPAGCARARHDYCSRSDRTRSRISLDEFGGGLKGRRSLGVATAGRVLIEPLRAPSNDLYGPALRQHCAQMP